MRLARLACLLGVVASSGFAAPLPVTLIWKAPEACPQYPEVWSRLTERLGRTPSAEGASFAARGQVEKAENGWRVELQTLTAAGAGVRVLTNSSCEELTRAAILVLALAIDPTLEPPPEVKPRSLWLALGPQVAIGATPFPAPGLAGKVTLDLTPVSLDLSIGTFLQQRLTRDGGRAVRVSVPIEGGLATCLGLRAERLLVQACVALQAALFVAEAEGVERPRLGQGALLSAGPRVQARVLLTSWVALRLVGDVSVAMLRPRFLFADDSEAWVPGLVSGGGALLVEFKVW
ncbi:MAG: hypothetical protein Q8L48_09945 [Archangium sp.]|nr:hypothetical protein [Archangium sp.]